MIVGPTACVVAVAAACAVEDPAACTVVDTAACELTLAKKFARRMIPNRYMVIGLTIGVSGQELVRDSDV